MPFSSSLVPADLAAADPDLRRLYAYWDEKRGNRPWPSRADLDELDLAPQMPFVQILDVLDGGAAFEGYRVTGVAGLFVEADAFGALPVAARALERFVLQAHVHGLRVGVVDLKSPEMADVARQAGAALLSGPAVAADLPCPRGAYPYALSVLPLAN